jgi:hypothetical protein
MSLAETVCGDEMLDLLGLSVDNARVQESLTLLARGMQPELDPEDEENLVDWVTVNELGLEYGFEDEAYVRALDPGMRRTGPLVLSQLYFYGDTTMTKPFPYPLPFGLTFQDNKTAVRRKMAEHEAVRRSYIRDAWRLSKYNVVVTYGSANGNVESVSCYLPYEPWPPLPGEDELAAPFTPEAFAELFGLRWSNAALRDKLAPFGFEEHLAEVRVEHVADFRTSHGFELMFAPNNEISAADQRYPNALALAGVIYYASRELDARQWAGKLPCGLAFTDTQERLRAKVGKEPAEQEDDNLSGMIVWHLDNFTLNVVYSNLENRPLRIFMMAPGYWEASSPA